MKNILITGCSKGIGFQTAKALALHNDINLIAVSRDITGLNTLKEECIKLNNKFKLHVLSLDLSLFESIDIIANYIKKNLNSSLDGLIHNAGLLVKKSFTDISRIELENSFRVNCFAPFLLTQSLMPFFNINAHIISISSMGGVQGSQKFPGLSAYSTSKSTLITLTECLAEEFKLKDVSFNCLALGAVQTEMLAQAFPGYKAPMSAMEMGSFISDFWLNGNKYFNGKVIPVSLTTP